MPRLTRDPNRLNYTVEQKGKEYNQRLLFRSQTIFTTLLNLLPSNYISTVQGPNYTNELKAVAVELARLELALEDVNDDRAFATTRPEFLYSIVGYLLLLNGRLPPVEFDDEQFRQFLLALVQIYFQGSIPESMADAVKLLVSGDVGVTENFLLVRRGASGYDISDQFGFQIDVVGNSFPSAIFDADSSLRLILDIIRPAHTLFTIRYVFTDKFLPNSVVERVLDACRWALSAYYYDDFRSNWKGLRDVDRLGQKVNQLVENEDHSIAMHEAPFLSEFLPSATITGESILLSLYGARFAPGAIVTIDGEPCGELFVTDRTITCTTPLFGDPVSAVVRVTNPDGQYATRSPFVVSAGGSGIALVSQVSMADEVSVVGQYVYSRETFEAMGTSDEVIAGNVGLPLDVDLSGDTLSASDSVSIEKYKNVDLDLSVDSLTVSDSSAIALWKSTSLVLSGDTVAVTDSVVTDLTVPLTLSDVYGATLAHQWASTYSTDSNGVSQLNDIIGTSHATPVSSTQAPEPVLAAGGYPTFQFDSDTGAADRMLTATDTILAPGGTVAFQVGLVCRIDQLTSVVTMMGPTTSATALTTFLLRNDAGALKVADIISGSAVDVVSSGAYGLNTWHTIVADFRSNNTVRLYVDGTYIGSGSINVATLLTRLSRMGFCTGSQVGVSATFGSCYIAYSSTDFALDHTAQTACRVMNSYLGDKSLPTITSTDYTVVDTGGGGSVTITGTNLGSAVSCKWGGTSCTITGNTSTTLTFTVPAKTAGTYNLYVTTPGGTTSPLSLEAWSPNQITGIDGYFDARKGVSVDGFNRVTTWTEQSRSAAYASPAANGDKPTLVASTFGSIPGIRFQPAFSTYGAQTIGAAAGKRVLASGSSVFWVSKHVSMDSVTSDPSPANPPLTVVGDLPSSSYANYGFSAGVMRVAHYTGSWVNRDRGSVFNDNVPRLYGWTHSTGGDLKAWVGTTQQGATISGETYNVSYYGYSTVGGGYKDNTNSWDGFDGSVGAVIVVDGIISTGDQIKLYAWAQSSFGV